MAGDPNPPIDRDDLAVTLAVRQDLGPSHDDAVIGEFLERVGHSIDTRVDQRMAASHHQSARGPAPARSAALGFASIGVGIPSPRSFSATRTGTAAASSP